MARQLARHIEDRTGMEYIKRQDNGENFGVAEYPNAAKIIEVSGPDAEMLADLCLHQVDLQFAAQCLIHLRGTDPAQEVLCDALWYSAILHWSRCFGGNNARHGLTQEATYRDAGENADLVYAHFQNLRNRHIAHDLSALTQARVGAVLAPAGGAKKVERVVSPQSTGVTFSPEHAANLERLIDVALRWVNREIDLVADHIGAQLEAKPYAELLAMPALDMLAAERQIYGTKSVGKLRAMRNKKTAFSWDVPAAPPR